MHVKNSNKLAVCRFHGLSCRLNARKMNMVMKAEGVLNAPHAPHYYCVD